MHLMYVIFICVDRDRIPGWGRKAGRIWLEGQKYTLDLPDCFLENNGEAFERIIIYILGH